MIEPTQKKKILAIDDTPENLDVLAGILQSEYTLFMAIKGPRALKIAKRQKPDLILLDIMMPDMDGYEVCRRLKADPDTADIPVIFITAKDQVADESKGFACGCVDYIKKPVSPPIVLARVKTHLALQGALEKLEQQNDELIKAAELRDHVERIARHDLKNPLTAIFSGIYFLEIGEQLDDGGFEIVTAMNEAAQDMLNMINSSLDLFKMEQDMYEPDLKNVDVMEIILRIQQDMQSIIQAKEMTILTGPKGNTPGPDTPFYVPGERLLIYSMMANLVKNALEASPRQGAVHVSLETAENQARICIHNMGAVPKELREIVFDKYVTHGKTEGTGLGTYSARLIARTLGGDISMESSDEKGTFFTITLPLP